MYDVLRTIQNDSKNRDYEIPCLLVIKVRYTSSDYIYIGTENTKTLYISWFHAKKVNRNFK